ncbi:hypothetical protein CMMCA001_10045 [Clavibacter michiganensis subsp. michiganensis]|nr:hypothetical protein CMMCA001_10045 [Clavibacter michiganensis subsp. michiganensis]
MVGSRSGDASRSQLRWLCPACVSTWLSGVAGFSCSPVFGSKPRLECRRKPSAERYSSISASLRFASSSVLPVMKESPSQNERSSARRPASTASARVSSMRARVFSGVDDRMNCASAFRAAKRRPTGEDPAWKSTGVRCGDGDDRCGPATL